jgi:hypothetical protein
MALTARDRRTLIIGGVVLGVLLVGVLLVNLLSGGGALPPLPSFSPRPPLATGTSSASATPESTPPPALSGRDPFSIPPGLGAGGSVSSGTASPTGTSSPTGTGSATASPTLPGNGSSTSLGGHTVVLLDVYSRQGIRHAQVEVDGTVYRPRVGGRFAGGEFKLVSTSGSCAVLLFGDQSFTLCTTPLK